MKYDKQKSVKNPLFPNFLKLKVFLGEKKKILKTVIKEKSKKIKKG